MIIISILSLLVSNAVTLRRDMSILFNRVTIIALTYCILHDTMSLSVISKGIGLHGGLLHITNITQVFQILIFLISILILQLTSFNPIIILVFLLIAALLAEAIIFLLEVNPLMLICLTFIFNIPYICAKRSSIKNFYAAMKTRIFFFNNCLFLSKI